MSTLKEVARKAGVSLGTAYNVISGSSKVSAELRHRVEKASLELAYRPNHVARSLKTRQTRMLGMVISDIANPFFPQVVRGAEDAAISRGFLLTTCNTDDRIEREKQVFEILLSYRVDGMLAVLALPRAGHRHVRDVLDSGTPMVFIDRVPQGYSADSVTVDNHEGVREAVEHLLAQGYREIAYIGGRSDQLVARERLSGYVAGMRAGGVQPVEAWMREGDFRAESGYALAKELLAARKRPRALFVANILMTTGVLRAMEELGLETPADLALVTFDHIALMDAFRPHLTAVEQPGYEIGRQAANLLIDRIEGKVTQSGPIRIKLRTELRVRQSSLPPA